MASGTTFDLTFLRQQVGNDLVAARELIELFCETLRETARDMETAEAAGDLRRLASLAHRLKSSALAIGAAGLAESCLTLQNKSGDAAAGREAIARVCAAAESLPPALQAALAQLDGGGDREP